MKQNLANASMLAPYKNTVDPSNQNYKQIVPLYKICLDGPLLKLLKIVNINTTMTNQLNFTNY